MKYFPTTRVFQSKQMLHLVSIIGLVIVILFLFSHFLSREYTTEAKHDVELIHHSKMLHVNDNTVTTLEHFKNYAISLFQEQTVSSWLLSSRVDPLEDTATLKMLNHFALLQPYISSIYVINANTNRILSTSHSASDFTNFEDQGILESINNHPTKFLEYRSHSYNSKEYLALIIPNTIKNAKGYMVVLYDKGKLEDFLFKNENASAFTISILDQDRKVVMGDTGTTLPNELPLPIATADSYNKYETKIGESTKIIYTTDLAPYNWRLYFTLDTNEMMYNIERFQKKITMTFIILITVVILVIIWSTFRTLRPFRRLADDFQNKLGLNTQSPSRGEADIIRTGFDYLIDSYGKAETSLRQYRDIAKEEGLRQWVLHGGDNSKHQKLQEISEIASLENIHIAVFRIESYKEFVSNYSFTQRKGIKSEIGHIVDETFRQEGWISEFVDMDGDHIVSIFGQTKDSTKLDDVDQILKITREKIDFSLKVSTAIAISDLITNQDYVKDYYDETYELTLLKFFTGENKIYRVNDLASSFTSNHLLLDETLINELIIAVKNSNQIKVKQVLAKFEVKFKKLSFDEMYFQLKTLLYHIFTAFNKVTNIQESFGSDALLHRFTSLTEVFTWIETELFSIMNQREGNSRKEEIVEEIIEYTQNHLQDPMLTVDSIAEHLGLSYSYVRSVFKDVKNSTLSEYILQERIEKVKNLLIFTDYTVSEITEITGFLTKSHFYSVFKKSTGVTPNQFRTLQKL